MAKAILMMLLAVVSGSATAEWVKIGGNDSNIAYADPATIRKDGSKAKIWHLSDFKKTQVDKTGVPYMSVKAQSEIDCKVEMMRNLYMSLHSENMGRGDVVFTESGALEWVPIAPGSAGEVMWKLICEKR